jgi:hypothetical protein
MADGWIDGLLWLPGRQAGGASGRIDRRVDVRHETIGTNSRQIGLNGYFNFRFPKVDIAEQYAEWWAIAWHACEWNPVGIGFELERFQGEPMTENQARWIAYTLGHIQAEAGALPLDWFDGDLYVPAGGGGYRGYANHLALRIQACDPHTDGWTFDEWQWICSLMGADPPVKKEDRMQPGLFVNPFGFVYVYDPNAHTKTWIRSPAALSAYQAIRGVSGLPSDVQRSAVTDQLLADAREVNTIPDPLPSGGGGNGGGATPDEVRQIVTADGNATRAEVTKPRPIAGAVG